MTEMVSTWFNCNYWTGNVEYVQRANCRKHLVTLLTDCIFSKGRHWQTAVVSAKRY